MSRIRGIEAKVQKEVLQPHTNGCHEDDRKENEERSICPKDDVEKQQISELLHKLPKLGKIFEVHRKIGEGTFSSVYLGSLRAHAGLPDARRRWFAIKHLVPTAHPARVEHELRCLQDIGGKHNVIGVDLCLRHFDTIVFVMPYIPHKKFSEYVGEMCADEVREYMRALLEALRHVHSFGVIHRDVKPSNFLYDRDNRRYLLVDFGLAQRVCSPPPAPAPPPTHHATKRPRDEEESPPDAKRVALDLSVGKRSAAAPPAATPAPPTAPAPASVAAGAGGVGGVVGVCGCSGVGGVCGECAGRGTARAARAGTQGFRPPEVLLKCGQQWGAVDVWASGVVLLSVLCARYPLLRAPDDAAALAELADLLGTRALHAAALKLGRRLVTSVTRRGLCLRKLCARLRGLPPPARPAGSPPPTSPCTRCTQPHALCLCRDDDKPATEFDPDASVAGFPDSAFALAARLLEPHPRARPSAALALAHPFLRDK